MVVVDASVLTVGVGVPTIAAVVGTVVTLAGGLDVVAGIEVVGDVVVVTSPGSGASCCIRWGRTVACAGASTTSADTWGGCGPVRTFVGRAAGSAPRVMSATVAPQRIASTTNSAAISVHARRVLTAGTYPPNH
jgi:hypothetical protein